MLFLLCVVVIVGVWYVCGWVVCVGVYDWDVWVDVFYCGFEYVDVCCCVVLCGVFDWCVCVVVDWCDGDDLYGYYVCMGCDCVVVC